MPDKADELSGAAIGYREGIALLSLPKCDSRLATCGPLGGSASRVQMLVVYKPSLGEPGA